MPAHFGESYTITFCTGLRASVVFVIKTIALYDENRHLIAIIRSFFTSMDSFGRLLATYATI